MFKFFGMLIRNTLALILAWVLFVVISLVILGAILGGLAPKPGPGVADGSFLVVDLSRPIPDTPPEYDFRSLLDMGEAEDHAGATYLREALLGLDRAKGDKRIKGLFLHGSLTSTSLTNTKALRQAVLAFKAEGKPVYAYSVSPSKKDLYLMSVADTFYLNPMAMVEFSGLAIDSLFWKGTLDKLGIGVQTARVGKFKSAVEPFTREEFSSEEREQLTALMNGLWEEYLAGIGEARGLDRATLNAVADTEGVLLRPERAVEIGLADELAYVDEVIEKLIEAGKKAKDLPTFEQVELSEYVNEGNAALKRETDRPGKIAVVYAEGPIMVENGDRGQIGGEQLARVLRKVRKDEKVKAVVLRVNSPGGSALGSELVLREMKLLREAKPVVASMGAVAASGGYWISTYADRIFAEPTTVTGSIGVFVLLMNAEEAAGKVGVTTDVVKTNRFADLFQPMREKSPEEMQLLQDFADHIYEAFVARVAESRNLHPDVVREVAQGRVWLGTDALAKGLVDELGGLPEAIAWAVKEAGVEGDHVVVDLPEKVSLEKKIQEALENAGGPGWPELEGQGGLLLRELEAELGFLREFNDPRGIYARLPYVFDL